MGWKVFERKFHSLVVLVLLVIGFWFIYNSELFWTDNETISPVNVDLTDHSVSIDVKEVIGDELGNGELKKEIPLSVGLPKYDIDLEVKPATVSGNTWDMFDDDAAWLSSSGTLEGGNMVIYAHNKRYMFGPIQWLSRGDVIEVGSESKLARYRVTKTFEGRATDIEYVTDPVNRLTLYTCSGPMDVKRYFVLAEAFEVESR